MKRSPPKRDGGRWLQHEWNAFNNNEKITSNFWITNVRLRIGRISNSSADYFATSKHLLQMCRHCVTTDDSNRMYYYQDKVCPKSGIYTCLVDGVVVRLTRSKMFQDLELGGELCMPFKWMVNWKKDERTNEQTNKKGAHTFLTTRMRVEKAHELSPAMSSVCQ